MKWIVSTALGIILSILLLGCTTPVVVPPPAGMTGPGYDEPKAYASSNITFKCIVPIRK